jgi:hypothetical protein
MADADIDERWDGGKLLEIVGCEDVEFGSSEDRVL